MLSTIANPKRAVDSREIRAISRQAAQHSAADARIAAFAARNGQGSGRTLELANGRDVLSA
jgi:hypothetical protein